jgi:hypothetical protein
MGGLDGVFTAPFDVCEGDRTAEPNDDLLIDAVDGVCASSPTEDMDSILNPVDSSFTAGDGSVDASPLERCMKFAMYCVGCEMGVVG